MNKIYKDADQEHLAAIFIENTVAASDYDGIYSDILSELASKQMDIPVNDKGDMLFVEDIFGTNDLNQIYKLVIYPGLYVARKESYGTQSVFMSHQCILHSYSSETKLLQTVFIGVIPADDENRLMPDVCVLAIFSKESPLLQSQSPEARSIAAPLSMPNVAQVITGGSTL